MNDASSETGMTRDVILEQSTEREHVVPEQPLKVGDTIVTRGYGTGWNLHKITRITPSGQIVCGNAKFNKLLNMVGTTGFGATYARRIDPEIACQIRRQTTLRRLRNLQFEKLSNEQLEEILKIASREVPQGRDV